VFCVCLIIGTKQLKTAKKIIIIKTKKNYEKNLLSFRVLAAIGGKLRNAKNNHVERGKHSCVL
jgi:hypothetical protein